MNYEFWMRNAIEVAKQNPHAPFGTVLVDSDTSDIVTTGVNQSSMNPLFHGEIVAMNNYAEKRVERWDHLTLFTTAEPCCMCQAAIVWAGIPRVVFGTSIKTLKDLGWNQFSLTAQEVVSHAEFSECIVDGGVLESENDALFRFANRK